MIDLGENFLAIVSGYIGELFSDFSPFIFLILGIGFAFWIIEKIKEMLEEPFEERYYKEKHKYKD